jgi:hypothetical protein
MTKTEKILTFDRRQWNSVQIAAFLGCAPSYVRAVWQRQNPLVREKDRLRNRSLWRTGDREAARKAFRRAYRKARLDGASSRDASQVGSRAYTCVINRTGDKRLAAKAWREAKI